LTFCRAFQQEKNVQVQECSYLCGRWISHHRWVNKHAAWNLKSLEVGFLSLNSRFDFLCWQGCGEDPRGRQILQDHCSLCGFSLLHRPVDISASLSLVLQDFQVHWHCTADSVTGKFFLFVFMSYNLKNLDLFKYVDSSGKDFCYSCCFILFFPNMILSKQPLMENMW
jgi:hypothetical protein